MRDDIAAAIRQRNVAGALEIMFLTAEPTLRPGFFTETDLWDFKRDCPHLGRDSENAWAELAKDVLAFHNNRGGLIFLGIADDFSFVGATPQVDSKKANDRLRRYLPDTIWVEFSREFIQENQRYLGVVLVPPRGPVPQRFRTGAPARPDGTRAFVKNGSALRENDSTRVLSPGEADAWTRSLSVPVLGQSYAVDESCYRILAPEYHRFIERGVCTDVEASLRDPRISVTSLLGVGGMGKTAIATWAVLRAFNEDAFDFIVSTTAKDRELTATGIVGLAPRLTSFETLLDEILDVTGFPDEKQLPEEEKERQVRDLLAMGKGLLYVDNLETVDDARIVAFLDSLPLGCKAIVTSRRVKVRVAAQPLEVPPMKGPEAVEYVKSLSFDAACSHSVGLCDSEIEELADAWDGIPLAIRWALSRSESGAHALQEARAARDYGFGADELLEFSFRRVFDSLSASEKAVLHTLGTLQQPIPIEALIVGAGLAESGVLDAVQCLEQDAIVQRVFDSLRNDYAFSVLPSTRAFIEKSLRDEPQVAERIRRSLSEWYQATDIADERQRLVVRELRQGRSESDSALVDLAVAARKRGDIGSAERMFEDAVRRHPRSWRAAREFAELQRHDLSNKSAALRLYEQAAANAPARGRHRALIFREWGLLLRDSGLADAAHLAEEKLQVALRESPADQVALTVLASLYAARGAYRLVIELLEPHADNPAPKFRERALPQLLKAYEALNEIGKAALLRAEMRQDRCS